MPTQQLQHMLGGLVFPSDTNEIWQDYELEYQQTSTLYIGEAGNVRVKTASGNIVTFKNLKTGQFVPVHVLQVFKTGTTAGKIIALDMKPAIPQVILDGLVMWHEFSAIPWDGTTDRLPDSSGTGNSAKMYTGTGLSFDGSNDSVTIGDTMNIVRSVVFYASADTATTKFMQLRASGAVDIGVASNSVTATGWTAPNIYVNGVTGSTITTNTWRHIAVTSDTQVLADNVSFGLSGSTYYDGSLSNVKFFSVKLTPQQVAELYANPEQIVPTGVGLNDLVGWWYMAEGSLSATAIDASGNNNNGLISGATTVNALVSPVTQLGLLGGSAPMYFDAVDDYINIGSFLNQSNNFTYFGYILKRDGTIWGVGNFLGIRIISGVLRFDILGVTTIASYSIASEKIFLNIAVTRSGNDFTLYVNGESVATGTNTISPDVKLLYLGKRQDSILSAPYTGIIFNSAFWNTALSANEIAELNSQGLSYDLRNNTGNYSSSSSLIAYYINTGNTDADWVDLSGNGNDGTVNGTPGTIWLPQGKEIGKDIVGMAQKYVNTGQLLGNPATFRGIVEVSDDNSLDLTTELTIEFWANLYPNPTTRYILYKGNTYIVYVTTTNRLNLVLYIGGAQTFIFNTLVSCIEQYGHIAITYDGTNVKLYDNGTLVNTVAITGSVDTNNIVLSLGGISTASSAIASGFLDSVKLYNTALTADQVLQNYNAERAKYI
jgi:hypothetical protein